MLPQVLKSRVNSVTEQCIQSLGEFKFKGRYLERITTDQLFIVSIMHSLSLHILFIANLT